MKQMFRGLIRSARLGMSPTLLSNGVAAWAVCRLVRPMTMDWLLVAEVVAMGFLFFLYGMWENDRVDARWDSRYRPNRPVPRGEVTTGALRVASLIAGLSALFVSASLTSSLLGGVLLIVVISLYNALHKFYSVSIVLMGACRGLWVLAAAMAFLVHAGDDPMAGLLGMPLYYALSLTVYTILASWVARGEAHNPVRKKIAGILLPGMSLHDAVWLVAMGFYGLSSISLACYLFALLLKKLNHRTT